MKIALVTGASRGIGAEIAKQLARDGFLVVINYKQSQAKAEQVLNQIIQNGGQAIIYKCDVSSFDDVEKMVSYLIKCYGKIDVLINNAGISLNKQFQDVTSDEWNSILANNLSSTFYMCKEVGKYMISQMQGKIINISSIWGQCGASMEVAYSATKAGIIGLTKALAKELAPSNIRVNCVAPGAIATEMMSIYSTSDIEELKEQIPLGELGQPSEIANMVSFLVSDQANYITGQVFGVNGGIVI